jgi:glutamate racemase
MSKAPIGIFDSGLGGLTVLRRIHKLLPNEQVIYLADSKNCPYGPKTNEEIIALSERCTQWLLAQGCKMIVLACNTATSSAISYLRDKYAVPFVGMEPAIKPAAQFSKTGAVGILATAGTLNGDLYKQTQLQYANHVQVHLQIGTGLVDLVESNKLTSPEVEVLLRTYIQPMMDANIDHLVLGCSHYPFLIKTIEKITKKKEGKTLKIIEPSNAVAQQTKRVLKLNGLLNPSELLKQTLFYTTGDVEKMNAFLVDVLKIKSAVCTKAIT